MFCGLIINTGSLWRVIKFLKQFRDGFKNAPKGWARSAKVHGSALRTKVMPRRLWSICMLLQGDNELR